jgi:hypothetical protein
MLDTFVSGGAHHFDVTFLDIDGQSAAFAKGSPSCNSALPTRPDRAAEQPRYPAAKRVRRDGGALG